MYQDFEDKFGLEYLREPNKSPLFLPYVLNIET